MLAVDDVFVTVPPDAVLDFDRVGQVVRIAGAIVGVLEDGGIGSRPCSDRTQRAEQAEAGSTLHVRPKPAAATETYSPAPMENAPATSPARPVSTMVCGATPPPPTPAIREALVTSPSTAPNTVGRSQPPETSRWRCAQPGPVPGVEEREARSR